MALADNSVRVYFERGAPLPAKRSFVHHTVESVAKGSSACLLKIPIIQGELEQAHVHRRDAEEERRLHFLQVLAELGDALGEVDPHAGADRAVDREHLLGDVRERQVRERAVARPELADALRGVRGERERLVREHHALELLAGLGEADIQRGLAAADALAEELQGGGGLADAGVALQQVEPVRREAAAQDVVHTRDTSRNALAVKCCHGHALSRRSDGYTAAREGGKRPRRRSTATGRWRAVWRGSGAGGGYAAAHW